MIVCVGGKHPTESECVSTSVCVYIVWGAPVVSSRDCVVCSV